MLPSFPLSLLQLWGSLPSACGGVSFYSCGSSENTNGGAAVPAQLCERGRGQTESLIHSSTLSLPPGNYPGLCDCVHACLCVCSIRAGGLHSPISCSFQVSLFHPDYSRCAGLPPCPSPFPLCFYNRQAPKAVFSLPPMCSEHWFLHSLCHPFIHLCP